MAFTPDDWFYSQWQGAVDLVEQQEEERMRPAVRVETASGEAHYFERLGPTTVVEVTTRHADSPIIEMDHQLRVVHPRFFVWSTIVDDEDKVRMLLDPTSIYNEDAGAGFARQADLAILQAAIGTSYTGKGGTTTETFPAGQIVATGSTTGLTQAKLISAMEILLANEVKGPYYMAIKASQNSDLLAIPQVTSVDFSSGMPLNEGRVQSYMGFNFIHTEQIATVSSSDHCIAWGRNSIGFAVWKEKEMNLQKDPTKNYNWRPHIKQFIGATRLSPLGVVEVDC